MMLVMLQMLAGPNKIANANNDNKAKGSIKSHKKVMDT